MRPLAVLLAACALVPAAAAQRVDLPPPRLDPVVVAGQTRTLVTRTLVPAGVWTEIAAVDVDSAQFLIPYLRVRSGFPFSDTTLAVRPDGGAALVHTVSAVRTRPLLVDEATGAAYHGVVRLYTHLTRPDTVLLDLAVIRQADVATTAGTLWAGAPVAAADPLLVRPRGYVRAYRVAWSGEGAFVAEASGTPVELSLVDEAAPFAYTPHAAATLPDRDARLMLTASDLARHAGSPPSVLVLRSPATAPSGAFRLVSAGATLTPVPDAEVQAWADAAEAARAAADACGPLTFDLATGRVNGVAPTEPMAAVHAALPCATGETAEGETFNRGGGVFYTDHQIYAYTALDAWDVREGFPGRIVPVDPLGSPFETALRLVEATFRAEADAQGRVPTPYGCLWVQRGHGDRSSAAGSLEAYARPCAEVGTD